MLACIFEKVLWNPLAFGAPHKGRERVWLGSVCRRFQRLVHASSSLDWQFSKPEDGNAFLCYVLRQQNNTRFLSRVALDVETKVQLVAILQSVIFQAQNNLEEIHLFVGHLVPEDADNWEYVFLLLAAVGRLRILDITLWGKEPRQQSLVALSTSWFPEPFRNLQSLTLYGFAIPSVEFGSFLARFPVLKRLELHSYVGETYALEASRLEKAFSWGNGNAGIDLADPAKVSLPRSLEKLVALLGSRILAISQKAAATLLTLSSDAATCRAIATVPGTLHRLVELLDSGVHTPAALLEKLAQESANKSRIASVPSCLQKLLFLLGRYEYDEHEIAARTLVSLAGDAHVQKQIVRDTDTVRRLVDNFYIYRGPRALSGWVLWSLAVAGVEDASATSGVQKVAALLDDAGLSLHLGKLLCVLCDDKETRRSVASKPGFVDSLFSLLTNEQAEIQTAAAESLQSLAGVAECRRLLVQVPGWLQTLIGLVEKGESSMQETAASVLWLLADKDAGVRRAVAGDAGVLRVLVSSLTSESSLMHSYGRQPVVSLLTALTREATPREAVARAPGCLQGLTGLLKYSRAPVCLLLEALRVVGADDVIREELLKVPDLVPVLVIRLGKNQLPGVILSAAGVLQTIAGDPETGKRIVNVPGCLQRLVELLKSGSGPLRKLAADVFSKLTGDAQLRKAVAEEPGAIEQLVVVLGAGGAEGAQRSAALALHSLAWDLECRPLIGATPSCVSKLFRLFKGPGEYVQEAAGEALWCIASGNGNRDAVWKRPGVLQELVGLLDVRCTDVQRGISARILHNLAHDSEETLRAIAAAPKCLDRLFGLLKSGESFVAEWGVRALSELVGDPETRTVVFQEPGFLQTLVRFLDPDAFDESMLDIAPDLLHKFLSADAKNREAFLATPGSLERLVRAVGSEAPEAATWLLMDLAGDSAVRRRIAGIPGALQKLVNLLSEHWMREVALEAILVFAVDGEIRRAIAAVPKCLEMLQTLTSLPDAEIQEGEDPGMRELAAKVLERLNHES